MCFDNDSRPPIAPIAGGAIDAGPLTLEGEDGTPFRAFRAWPFQPTGAGILILPDVRGLHPYYEELALRYAEHGIEALAIDYFGRTAGVGPRDADFDSKPHAAELRWDDVAGDIRAGVARLRASERPPRSVFTTGFCVGGRLASLSATLGLGLAGVVSFYGWPAGPNRGLPAPVDVAAKIECGILAIYGGADERIPAEARDAFDAALEKAGAEHRTVVYPGAPHGFFDRKAADFSEASEQAWAETLAFIRRHTAGQPIAARG
ncbi:MAG TPA: dienelactone hydrolase family protein [Candidatus Eisenbacteria bacterium]|nr:dienelactone hydrolase family protein [Candidatus Eisenbacteria bacterium]